MSVPLAFAEFGSGPPVVIAHGLLGSKRNWRAVAEQLEGSFHVFAVDMRNHGESPAATDMSYGELAQDLREFLVSQGLTSSALVGHSMGGKAAMALALTAPEVISNLIVLDIAPISYSDELTQCLALMGGGESWFSPRNGDPGQQLAAALSNPAISALLVHNLMTSGDHFDWRVNLHAVVANMENLSTFPQTLPERSFSGPTLFLHSALSEFVRPEHHEAIHNLFPGAEVRLIDGVGHWMHADQPQAVAREILSFLSA